MNMSTSDRAAAAALAAQLAGTQSRDGAAKIRSLLSAAESTLAASEQLIATIPAVVAPEQRAAAELRARAISHQRGIADAVCGLQTCAADAERAVANARPAAISAMALDAGTYGSEAAKIFALLEVDVAKLVALIGASNAVAPRAPVATPAPARLSLVATPTLSAQPTPTPKPARNAALATAAEQLGHDPADYDDDDVAPAAMPPRSTSPGYATAIASAAEQLGFAPGELSGDDRPSPAIERDGSAAQRAALRSAAEQLGHDPDDYTA